MSQQPPLERAVRKRNTPRYLYQIEVAELCLPHAGKHGRNSDVVLLPQSKDRNAAVTEPEL